MRGIFITGAVIIALIGLVYVANYGVSTHALPSLQEFIASSTVPLNATSTESASSTDQIASSTANTEAHSILTASTASFRVIVAKTPETRERGLSGHAPLAADEGMLFIFPQAGEHGFWMKDMNFPIDIVWMDSSKKIIGISANILPETYPETFLPPSKTQFVLELNAGIANSSGLATGTRVVF